MPQDVSEAVRNIERISNMGNLYRAISADGSVFAEVLDAKDIVSEIE